MHEIAKKYLFYFLLYCDFNDILACDPGYAWHDTELQCEICPPWAYSPTGDNCIRCPAGQRTSREGSTSSNECHDSKKLSIQTKTPQNSYLISIREFESTIIIPGNCCVGNSARTFG